MSGAVISRRVLLRSAAAAAAPAAVAQTRTARVLALIGDRYHNADYIRVALARMFAPLNVSVDYTIDTDRLSRDGLRGYRLFVCLRDGMIWPGGYLGPDAYTSYEHDLENRADFPEPKPESWLKQEQAAALKDFVASGNGFYAFHNSSHISLSSSTWRDVLGGAYIGHPPLRPFRVRVVDVSQIV